MYTKRLVLGAILILLLLSSVPLSTSAQTSNTDANKLVYLRFAEEFFNQRKWDIGSELFTSDVILHQPAAPVAVGLDALQQSYQGIAKDWPDSKVTSTTQIAEGDYVGGPYFYETTFDHPVPGPAGELQPTGKKVQFNGTMLTRFSDGKIAEVWAMWDTWNIFQQIGIAPAAGELPPVTPWVITLGSTSSSPQENKDVVARGFETWPQVIPVDVIALDYVVHTPTALGPNPEPGFAGYATWTKQNEIAFPDLEIIGPNGEGDYLMIAEGDLVVILYAVKATFSHDMMGLPATGAVIQSPSLSVLRIKDGQVAEFWMNLDTASMFSQMMTPPA